MRLGRNVVVRPMFAEKRLISFVDDNENFAQDLGEDELSSLSLVGLGGDRGIFLMGPDGVAGTDEEPGQALDGFTTIVSGDPDIPDITSRSFEPDGSIRDHGGSASRTARTREPLRGARRPAGHCQGGGPEIRLWRHQGQEPRPDLASWQLVRPGRQRLGMVLTEVFTMFRSNRLERAPGAPAAAGFSLIEVLIAMGLAGLLMIGVLPLFTKSMANNVKGNQLTEVTNRARLHLEELMAMPVDAEELTVPDGDNELVRSISSRRPGALDRRGGVRRCAGPALHAHHARASVQHVGGEQHRLRVRGR